MTDRFDIFATAVPVGQTPGGVAATQRNPATLLAAAAIGREWPRGRRLPAEALVQRNRLRSSPLPRPIASTP